MAKAPIRKKDELDQLAEGDPKRVMALMFWKARFTNPEMNLQITLADIKGFNDCVEYLKVKPEVRIVRPLGRPAQDAIPAVGHRRAVPGYAAEPPRPFVVVGVVEAGTENSIRPVENNEEDNNRRIEGETVRRARDNAAGMASRLEAMTSPQAEISSTDLRDAATALRVLARALIT